MGIHAEPGTEVSLALSREAVALNRQASDIAGLCREIVTKTAQDIGGRKHVRVEGWTSIATTYGCITTIKSVERINAQPGMAGGILAIAELHRISDGALLSTGQGFVGEDEPTWYGGTIKRWSKVKNCEIDVLLPKRADFSIRAMAQTRATSRVCRGPFSHVVVLIDSGLSTTPAEEVIGSEDDIQMVTETKAQAPAKAAESPEPATKAPAKPIEVPRDAELGMREQFKGGKWKKVRIHFGKNGPKDHPPAGLALDELETNQLRWYVEEWQPKPFGNPPRISADDLMLRAALDAALDEEFSK